MANTNLDAVVLVTGNKDATASPHDDSVALPDEDDESPTPTPNSSLKEELRQSTIPQSHELEEIRQIQQKLLQQQEELRQKQQEIEEKEKALNRQISDSEDEELQPFHQHLVNSAYGIASPAPSPTLQQRFFPLGNYSNACFHFQPHFPPVILPQVTHHPINQQRTLHPSQYRRERPPLQRVQVEEQQQYLRQQSSDGAAAVLQPVQTVAKPYQVEHPLPAKTLKIFNKIRQNFQKSSLNSEEDFVHYVVLRQTDVCFFYKNSQQVEIIYDNLEVFLRQNAADNHIFVRRHSEAPTILKQKAAWITFLKTTDVVTIKGVWDSTHLYSMLGCCGYATEMYLHDISFPKVSADLLRQHLPKNIYKLLIDFRQSETPTIADVFTAFSLDFKECNHRYSSFTIIVSAFPQKEIIDTLIKKLRQYFSEKTIILVDEEPYDCHLRLLRTRQFVFGGFATYFAAKEEFIIFKHVSNDGDICIGFRAPKEDN